MKANKLAKLGKNDQAYAAVVGGVVALLIMIIVGVLVYWETSEAVTLDSDDANSSKNETDDMASTVFELLPIVALVVVASVIIGIVIRFGSGTRGL